MAGKEPLILDRNKKDLIRPEVGDLVRHVSNTEFMSPGRIIRVGQVCGCCPDVISIFDISTGDEYKFSSRYLELITRETVPESDQKSPPIHLRRKLLLGNLIRCKERLEYEDRRLLLRLDNWLAGVGLIPSHIWFPKLVSESLDDPRKIAYAPSIELADNDKRRRKCSISRFLKGKAVEYGASFSSREADRIGYLFGIHFPGSYNYEFEILSGIDLYNAYCDTPDNWHSCMSGRPYVGWYSANPESVSLLKITLNGDYAGRGLLWTTTEGKKVLDRIYPSDNGPQMIAAHRYAEENGWDYKVPQDSENCGLKSRNTQHKVRMKTARMISISPSHTWGLRLPGYPYLDTFKFTNDDPEENGLITLNLVSGDYIFNETNGGFSGNDSALYCEVCDDRIYEDDACSTPDNEYICQDCFNENWMELDYSMSNGDYARGTYRIDDTVECSVCHNDILREHTAEIGVVRVCSDCSTDIIKCRMCGILIEKGPEGWEECQRCRDIVVRSLPYPPMRPFPPPLTYHTVDINNTNSTTIDIDWVLPVVVNSP